MTRRWSINGRFLGQRLTGVQRYAREIVQALDRHMAGGHALARDLEVELLVPPGPLPDDVRFEAIRVRATSGPGGHAWEQAVLPRETRSGLVSLCNTGPLLVRKHVVCMHDVNTRAAPQSYSLSFRALYGTLLPALGRTARTIATVSNYSAGELARYRIARADKIVVAPDGYEHALRWTATHTSATRAAAGPGTVVIIGSPAPHKNVGIVLGLAARLGEAGLRVAVAGASDARVFQSGADLASAPNIMWLGRLTDDELAALLQDSLCLAFPSLAEGFGLPALEAMAQGCPVVSSTCASLPEICGDAALYAPPFDADAWFAAFVRLRDDKQLRSDLIARGKARAPNYSWTRSAEIYLEAMARLDGVAA
jgi:glycosyltransferase involved in cell wall biosynthesis